jgi:lipoate-protein ligase A
MQIDNEIFINAFFSKHSKNQKVNDVKFFFKGPSSINYHIENLEQLGSAIETEENIKIREEQNRKIIPLIIATL